MVLQNVMITIVMYVLKLVLCLMILMQHIYLLWVTLTATVIDHHGFLTSFLNSQSITHYCVPTETVWGTCLHIVKMMGLAPHGSTTFCVANFWMTELLISVFGMTFSAQITDLCQWPCPIWRLIYVLLLTGPPLVYKALFSMTGLKLTLRSIKLASYQHCLM